MKRIKSTSAILVLAVVLTMILSSCHSSKKCPAYQDVSKIKQEQTDKANI